MTIIPISLPMLKTEYLNKLYERVQKDEEVFRNILLSCADNDKEIFLFKKGDLESIFDKFIRVEGYDIRISDFRKGPFNEEPFYLWEFPKFKSENLKENNALLYIQHSNSSFLKIYNILNKNKIKLIDTKQYHQL